MLQSGNRWSRVSTSKHDTPSLSFDTKKNQKKKKKKRKTELFEAENKFLLKNPFHISIIVYFSKHNISKLRPPMSEGVWS